jgi:DNA-binding transcriptional LysR family regulator
VLARERLVLAVPSDHRLGTGPIRLADLADEDFVVYAAAGSVVGEAAARACRAAGFSPRSTHHADQTSIVLALVAAGVGVALLPSSVLAVAVAGVRYVELDEPPPSGNDPVTTDVALSWRRDDPQPALARALAVLCRPDPRSVPA